MLPSILSFKRCVPEEALLCPHGPFPRRRPGPPEYPIPGRTGSFRVVPRGARPRGQVVQDHGNHNARAARAEVRFPPERGELTRGVPTSYAAEPLRRIIAQGNEPIPVWPYEEGKQRGISFEPLYKTAPIAALRDPSFYEYLALADGLGDSRVRERKIAEKELCRRLREASERTKS